jgi:preprotein translocase subunit SecE
MIKIVNKACQVLAALAGLATLVFFFFTFVTFGKTDGSFVDASGFQLAFGNKLSDGVEVFTSPWMLFNFWAILIATVTAIFTFFSKSRVLKYFSTAVALVAAVFMLVIALRHPNYFVNTQPYVGITLSSYTVFVLLSSIAMFVATGFGVAHFLVSDYIDVLESKGAKKPLLKRIGQFFKDYKSETKKIVWPGLKEVLKNTGIVLVMFVIIGAIIWLVDFGLGNLLEALLK